jgi:hypothetical protein
LAAVRSVQTWAAFQGVIAYQSVTDSRCFRCTFSVTLEFMRLLAEILIIATLIFFGWNKPFKDQVAQANTTITNKLHGLGSKLQKHQDPSVRRP